MAADISEYQRRRVSREGDSAIARCLRAKDKVFGNWFRNVVSDNGLAKNAEFRTCIFALNDALKRVLGGDESEEAVNAFMEALKNLQENQAFVTAFVSQY